MNNILLRRAITCGFLLAAASGAVFAELQSGSYASTDPGAIRQGAAGTFQADAKYEAGAAYRSYPTALAEGEGQQETASFCSMCHSTRYITMQPPLPAATWDAEVNKMIKTYGAPIPDAAGKKIVLYLQQHYQPENRRE